MTGCANRAGVLAIADRLVSLAERLGVGSAEMERLIGVRQGVWPMTGATRILWWPTVEQADRIGAVHAILVNLVAVMGARDARVWLRARNPGIGISPMRFMLSGRVGLEALHDMLAVEQTAC